MMLGEKTVIERNCGVFGAVSFKWDAVVFVIASAAVWLNCGVQGAWLGYSGKCGITPQAALNNLG